jgi:hypothetical protein
MECDVMAALFDDFVGTQHETSRHLAVDCLGGILTTSLNLLGCSTGSPRAWRRVVIELSGVSRCAKPPAAPPYYTRGSVRVRFGGCVSLATRKPRVSLTQ